MEKAPKDTAVALASLPHFPGAAFDIVALASSAGGLGALSRILAMLPAAFPAALVIVQHLGPRHRSMLADILNRRTPLRVKQAEEGDQLYPGAVYIAPPNHHLLVNLDGSLALSLAAKVHFLRPQRIYCSSR
jgi:two-component system, chemotaxis family, protein-glutamate methylesterase/glutaminase